MRPIEEWAGIEVKALRRALRLSGRAYAEHRHLIAASTEDGRVFVIDGRHARRPGSPRSTGAALAVPAAYELDDLTWALLWAIANLDDPLLVDDRDLAERRGDLASYVTLSASAASADVALDLAAASRMWLGSESCARHILRHSECFTGTPLFWTREQRGEEAAPWLLFRHKLGLCLRRAEPAGQR